jgi:predicted RNA-binding protein
MKIDPESIALRFNNCIGNADIDGLSELMTEDHVFIDTENNRIEGYSVCSDEKLDNVRAIWLAEVREDKVSLWPIYPDTEENRKFLKI